MQVPSVDEDTILSVHSTQLRRMKIHRIPVCSKRCDRRIHHIQKTAQSHIQKTHAKIQFISGSPQDLTADLLKLLSRLFLYSLFCAFFPLFHRVLLFYSINFFLCSGNALCFSCIRKLMTSVFCCPAAASIPLSIPSLVQSLRLDSSLNSSIFSASIR